MGFYEFFDFDEAAYEKEISCLTEAAIRREHAIIMQNVVGGLAGHGASAFVGQNTHDVTSLAIHNMAPFAHAVGAGFETQVTAVSQGLAGHAAQLIPVDAVSTCTTGFAGNMVGQALAYTTEIWTTKMLASVVADKTFGVFVNPKIEYETG